MFLTELFDRKLGYSAINTAKSALSNIVSLTDCRNIQVGQHFLIKRFLKGVYNSRPSLPRYGKTWDAGIVLRHLCSIELEGITLRQLTYKTTMLLALLSGQRLQTLHCLSVDKITFYENKVDFYIDSLLKQSRPGKHFSVLSFQKYHDKNLCIVEHLKKYIELTKSIRSSEFLLVSYQKPFQRVSTDTISRWIKTIMSECGIDTTLFQAHSTRSASTSAAVRQGLSVDEVLSKVGWSSADTFAKFYNKPIYQSLDHCILDSALQNSDK